MGTSIYRLVTTGFFTLAACTLFATAQAGLVKEIEGADQTTASYVTEALTFQTGGFLAAENEGLFEVVDANTWTVDGGREAALKRTIADLRRELDSVYKSKEAADTENEKLMEMVISLQDQADEDRQTIETLELRLATSPVANTPSPTLLHKTAATGVSPAKTLDQLDYSRADAFDVITLNEINEEALAASQAAVKAWTGKAIKLEQENKALEAEIGELKRELELAPAVVAPAVAALPVSSPVECVTDLGSRELVSALTTQLRGQAKQNAMLVMENGALLGRVEYLEKMQVSGQSANLSIY